MAKSGKSAGATRDNRLERRRGPYKFDDAAKERFLRALETLGTVSAASKAANINSSTAYEHRKTDHEFAVAWAEAYDAYCDSLEQEAYRRAVKGVDEPVFYQGEKCGVIRKYSDTLLDRLLKGHRPERYRETRTQVNIQNNGHGAPRTLTPDERRKRLRELEAKVVGVIDVKSEGE